MFGSHVFIVAHIQTRIARHGRGLGMLEVVIKVVDVKSTSPLFRFVHIVSHS